MKSIASIIKEQKAEPKYIAINSIKIDPGWWDRDEYNRDAIERYRQLYEDGAEAPVLIQKGTKLLIDGYHRVAAAKDAKKERIVAVEIEVENSEIPLIQIQANLKHGVPLSHTERDKAIIRAYILGHKTQKAIAEITGLSQQRISRILKQTESKDENTSNTTSCITCIPNDIPAEDKEALTSAYEEADKRTKVSPYQRLNIVRDFLAGFTQEETGNKFGISQQRVGQIVNEFKDELASFYSFNADEGNSGHSKREVATQFGLTTSQIDALLLDYNPEPLNFELPLSTWWPAFHLHHSQANYPGITPLNLAKSVLALFTRPGDHIVDPMAGSGTIGLACEDMIARSYELFDVSPSDSQFKINTHNLIREYLIPILPKVAHKPDLVFLDPPYSKVGEGKYQGDHDLAKFEQREFLVVMHRLFKLIHQEWHPCRVVCLISNLNKGIGSEYKSAEMFDTPSYLSLTLSTKYYRPLDHIVNEVGNSASHTPLWKHRATEGRWLFRGHIHILVSETCDTKK